MTLLELFRVTVFGVGLSEPRNLPQMSYIYGLIRTKQLDNAEYLLQALNQSQPYQSSLTMVGRKG